MDILKGILISYTIFCSTVGDYAVVLGQDANEVEVRLTGGLCAVCEGAVLDVCGEWGVHPRYGKQFNVHSYVEQRPTSVAGIESYLKSGLINGIDASSARSIVAYFKESTFDVLDNDPDRLKEVTGLSTVRIDKIKAAWTEQQNMRDVMLYLQAYGLNMSLILRIYNLYGQDSIKAVQENPYCLVDAVEGIGFKMADAVALSMGIDKEGYERCSCGIKQYLTDIGALGHCYSLYSSLLLGAAKLLEISSAVVDIHIKRMCEEGEIVIDENTFVYSKRFYMYETGVAEDIRRIMEGIRERDIRELKYQNSGIDYTEKQMQAIEGSINHKFMVLTGEPGSGKTTTVKGIVDMFINGDREVLLASPVGRAAKVLTEAAGYEATTIHRLLGYNPTKGFSYNKINTLRGDVLIVDEISMADIEIMYHLLSAVPDEMSVILVGDAGQLPSVGPGNVLQDIISSGVVPVVQLDQIFRQCEGSDIIGAAHCINQGIMPDLSVKKDTQFFFIQNIDETTVAEMVVKLRAETLPSKKGVDPISDIHVISPMYDGEAGVDKLNIALQQALNKNIESVVYGKSEFHAGDRVLQKRNDYEKDVFNGSVGTVISVDSEGKSILVDFGEGAVEYSKYSFGDLTLGYATTVHKAQGAEYPIVIIPLVRGHARMWYRKILYTGVTRGKSMVVLVGSEDVLRAAIANNKVTERNTRLWARLGKV